MESVEPRLGGARALLFESETYPEIRRETAWREFLTPLGFSPLRARDDGFFANARALYSPLDIGFARIAAAPHGLAAVPSKAAAPLILLHVDGTAALRAEAAETELKPGDVVILPRSGDAELVYASPFRALAVAAPRDVFGARLAQADVVRPARVAPSQGIGRVLSAMLASIAGTMDTLSSRDLSTIDLALSELLLAEFDERGETDTGASATQAALRRRLCQAIESRLADPDLTLAQVTQTVGISERYAQKLFETMGESFTHYVRDRRLLRSRRELGSPRHASVSVSEIGYRCGFNDAAHFSRVFRERFGIAPREHRQRALERAAAEQFSVKQRGLPRAPIRRAAKTIAAPSREGRVTLDPSDIVLDGPCPAEPTFDTVISSLRDIGADAPRLERATPRRHVLTARSDTVHWGYFSRAIPAVLTIASGDIVEIETLTQHASDDPARMIEGDPGAESVFRWTREGKGVERRGAGPIDASIFGRGAGEGFGVHVCTGPIAIAGAQPGDVVEVRILDVKPRPSRNPAYAGRVFGSNVAAWWGYHYGEFLTGIKPREVVTIYEVFPDAEPPHARAVYNYQWTPQTDPYGTTHVTYDYPGVPVDPATIKSDHGALAGVRVPMRLHFGVIAVAPREARMVDSIPPSYFGGNLDNWRIGKGATVYLPVAVPGALLSVGDPHAAQGDGELCGTAIECSLTGEFQVVLHKRRDQVGHPFADLDHPLIETETEWILPGFSHPNYLAAFGEASQSEVYCHSSLDLAMKDAFRKMRRFLMTTRDLSEDEAVSLMAVAVDFGVTQVVDGNWGVHAILKKSVFGAAARSLAPVAETMRA